MSRLPETYSMILLFSLSSYTCRPRCRAVDRTDHYDFCLFYYTCLLETVIFSVWLPARFHRKHSLYIHVWVLYTFYETSPAPVIGFPQDDGLRRLVKYLKHRLNCVAFPGREEDIFSKQTSAQFLGLPSEENICCLCTWNICWVS